MRRLAAAGIILSTFCSSTLARPSDGPSLGRSVEDAEYGFRIVSPGTGWYVLSRQSAKALAPNALGGLAHECGLVGFVAAVSTSETDLEKLARDFVAMNRLEGKSTDAFESTEFRGKSAWSAVVTGRHQGRPYRAESLFWLERGLFFQLVAMGPADASETSGASFGAIRDSFEFLAGGPREDAGRVLAVDANGLGWRVRSGRFEHGVFGFSVEPRGTWRLAVGDELSKLTEDAAVGLVNLRPPAHVVFVPERVPASVRKAHADRCAAEMARRAAPVTGVSFPATFGGESISLDRYAESGGRDAHVFSGILYRGDVGYRVTAVLRSKPDSAAMDALQEAIGSFRFLTEEESAAVAKEIDALEDPESSIGANHSLRDGTYRDFEFGFTWTKPSRAFSVRRLDPSEGPPGTVTLEFESPSTGLFGWVSSESAKAFAPADYHRMAVEALFGEGNDAPQTAPGRVALGEVDGLVSIGARKNEPLPSRCHVATAVSGGRAYQVIVYGMIENVTAGAAHVEAAIRGLHVAAGGLLATEVTESTVRDHRLGIELRRPADGWTYRKGESEELNEIGGALTWSHGSKRGIVALAKTAPDVRWDQDSPTRIFLSDLPRLAVDHFGTDPIESRSTLGGRPCRQFTWETGKERFDAFVLRRGAVYVAIMVSTSENEPALETAKACVSFLP